MIVTKRSQSTHVLRAGLLLATSTVLSGSLALAQEQSLSPLPRASGVLLDSEELARELPPRQEASQQETARGWDSDRPDALPPPYLPNTFVLDEGRWMVTYRFEQHSLDGLRTGREDLTSEQVFETPGRNYSFAPTGMTRQTYTFEGHYGVAPGWTVFASLPFHKREMEIDNEDGSEGTLRNEGVGDVRIGAITQLDWTQSGVLRAHLGVGLPTGSFRAEDDEVPLPFAMQNGIGSLALHPGFTYMRQTDSFSYGLWGEGRLHIGDNADGYGAGDTFQASLWAAAPFSRAFSGSLRLSASWWGDFHGESETINGFLSPVNEDENQGGYRLDLFGGLLWDLSYLEKTHRLGFEVGLPVDEWLDGPALSTEYLLTLSWQTSL